MKRVILFVCLALFASLGAVAQGPKPAVSTRVARYLFGINSGQSFGGESGPTIQVLGVDETTRLTRPVGLVKPSSPVFGVAVHPNGRFAYFSAGTEVLAYTVDGNGTLRIIKGSPFSAPGATSLTAIAVSPSGKFLIAADFNLNAVWSYAVNATTGALVLASGAPFPTGTTPLNLTFDTTSAFAYVSCQGTGISAYSIDQTGGALTAVAGSPFALSRNNSVAAGVTLDGSGNYLYVEGQIGVDGYKINLTTGALQLIAGSPFANGMGGGLMATDPLGKFIYGFSDVGTSVYTVNSSTGALTQLTTSPFGAIAPDPTGNYLYGFDVIQINRSTGALTLLEQNEMGLAYALSTGTAYVKYIPKFAYVANSTDGTVSEYTIDRVTGLLTSVETFAVGKSPRFVTADIYGKYLYVANSGSNTLSAFRINPKTGALTATKGSPYATDQEPLAIAVSPSDDAVYVATDAETVDSFAVSTSTGELTNIGSTWYGTACGYPTSLALDPQGSYLYAACSSDVAAATIGPPLSVEGTLSLSVATRSLVMHPRGTSVYVTTAGAINQITASGFNLVGPNYVAFGDNTLTGGLALDPVGRFLFAMEGDANVVQAETIAENGSMTEISGSPFTTGNYPAAAAVDFSGKFLYVVNQNDNNISGFAIDQTTGALTPLSRATFTTGKGPTSIAVTGIAE